MSRALWFVAGAGAGVYAVARARRAAEVLTPEGLADRLSALALGTHLFREEVRAGSREKEAELRSRLELAGAPATVRALTAVPTTDTTDTSDSTENTVNTAPEDREGND